MNRLFALIFALLAFMLSNRADADDFLSVSQGDKKFLAEILNAVRKGDTAWIADQMIYPLSVSVSNETQIVNSKEEFKPILDRQLSPEIRTNIVNAAKDPLFKNWKGIMVGDGIVWFTEFGESNSWYGIDAIGCFAFQTSEPIISDK